MHSPTNSTEINPKKSPNNSRKHAVIALVVLLSSGVGALIAQSRQLAQATSATVPTAASAPAEAPFRLLSNFRISGKVAEIVAATPDGSLLAYSDSESQEIGFVNIADPAKPKQTGTLKVPGEPTSVAITPNGQWLLCVVHGTPDQLLVVDLKKRSVVRKMVLGGQPDCIAISADNRFAAIAIENERPDQKAPMPQQPAGFLTIVDMVGAPAAWKQRKVELAGLATRFPDDPEPEFIAINSKNQAAVTLQENNHVAIIDLATGKVLKHWSTGTTSHAADLQADKKVDFAEQLKDARREPDAIAWTPGGNLITANEGDYDLDLKAGEFTGGRNWTLFSPEGKVLYDDATIEPAMEKAGLYPDKRSDKHGVEPEGATVAKFGQRSLAFIGCERADGVAVYDIANEAKPQLLQVLTTGDKPEGLIAIPKRGMIVTANEGDGTLSIFRFE